MSKRTLQGLTTATVYSLEAARERRYYINLAKSSTTFQSIKDSFTLSGIVLDEDNAEQIGRMIAKHQIDGE